MFPRLLVYHLVLLYHLVELSVQGGFVAAELPAALRATMLLLLDNVLGCAHGAVRVLDRVWGTLQGSMVVAFWAKQMQHYFYSLSSPLAVSLESEGASSD